MSRDNDVGELIVTLPSDPSPKNARQLKRPKYGLWLTGVTPVRAAVPNVGIMALLTLPKETDKTFVAASDPVMRASGVETAVAVAVVILADVALHVVMFAVVAVNVASLEVVDDMELDVSAPTVAVVTVSVPPMVAS